MSDVIEHFGVKGMRWGVRKKRDTPPIKNDITSEQKVRRRLVAKRVAIGAAVLAAAGLAVYGGYQYQNYNAVSSQIKNRVGSGFAGRLAKNYGKDTGTSFEKGHEFFRVSDVAEKAMKLRTYASSNKSDALAYDYLGKHNIKITALTKIVTPNTKERVDAMIEVNKGKNLLDLVKDQKSLGGKVALYRFQKENAMIDLDRIINKDWSDPKAEALVKNLISKGFSATMDDFDMGSAYVLFNPKNFAYSNVKNSYGDVAKAYKNDPQLGDWLKKTAPDSYKKLMALV